MLTLLVIIGGKGSFLVPYTLASAVQSIGNVLL